MARNVRETFGFIDQEDAAAFTGRLTEDVYFRFGNNDPAIGRAAVTEGVTGFWSSISGLTHHVRQLWEVGPDTVVVFADVEYRRLDGHTVYTPNVDVLHYTGDLVDRWEITIDLAAVYQPYDEVPAAAKVLAGAAAV